MAKHDSTKSSNLRNRSMLWTSRPADQDNETKLYRSFVACRPPLLLRGGSTFAQVSEMPPTLTSEAADRLDAYVHGYSLMTTDSRESMSYVDKIAGMHAPTADTLYSVACLDLAEPQVFGHPDMGKRFYLFEMTDPWMTDFNSPGTRTAGGDAAINALGFCGRSTIAMHGRCR